MNNTKLYKFYRAGTIFCIVLSIISCGSLMKVVLGIPALKVYTRTEVSNNIGQLPKASNIIDAQLSGIPEESQIKNYIYEAVMQKTYLYNRNKTLLCFKGDNSCTKMELYELSIKPFDSLYAKCDDGEEKPQEFADLDKLLDDFSSDNEKNSTDYKYTVVTFWNTDIEKGEIRENWDAFHSYFNEEDSILFIRLWTDLSTEWNLKENGKATFKNRKVSGEKGTYTLVLGDLPYN
jgi:hypothetical protein